MQLCQCYSPKKRYPLFRSTKVNLDKYMGGSYFSATGNVCFYSSEADLISLKSETNHELISTAKYLTSPVT